jgi:hypothetical protein
LTRLKRYCHTCCFWEWDANIYLPNDKVAYPGHCGLMSAACVNEVADDDDKPVHYRSLEESYEEDIPSV